MGVASRGVALIGLGLLSLAASHPLRASEDCQPPEPLPKEELPNLEQLKLELTYYHCSGAYDAAVKASLDAARQYLEERVARTVSGEHLAVVLDIDETSLTNWPEFVASDFGFVQMPTCTLNAKPPGGCGFDTWVNMHRAEAIGPTLDFFNAARAKSVQVFFITSRPPTQRRATVENLHRAHYRDWGGLYMKGKEFAGKSVQSFKTEMRKRIELHFTIIANVGDQESDLAGDHAERCFKVPNPFYLIPKDAGARPSCLAGVTSPAG